METVGKNAELVARGQRADKRDLIDAAKNDGRPSLVTQDMRRGFDSGDYAYFQADRLDLSSLNTGDGVFIGGRLHEVLYVDNGNEATRRNEINLNVRSRQ